MTYEEQQQYSSLSYNQKQEYDFIKRTHPNWNHTNILKKLALSIKIEDMMGTGAKDVENDPEILKEILLGAKSFLLGIGCFVLDVFEAIDDALDTLTDIIAEGISYVGDQLRDFWDWLTS